VLQALTAGCTRRSSGSCWPTQACLSCQDYTTAHQMRAEMTVSQPLCCQQSAVQCRGAGSSCYCINLHPASAAVHSRAEQVLAVVSHKDTAYCCCLLAMLLKGGVACFLRAVTSVRPALGDMLLHTHTIIVRSGALGCASATTMLKAAKPCCSASTQETWCCPRKPEPGQNLPFAVSADAVSQAAAADLPAAEAAT
jgi:hypothetical protein